MESEEMSSDENHVPFSQEERRRRRKQFTKKKQESSNSSKPLEREESTPALDEHTNNTVTSQTEESTHTSTTPSSFWKTEDESRTIVFSSSMARNIDRQDFDQRLGDGRARFQIWGGARAEYFKGYLEVHLKSEQPNRTILLCGGNNLPTSRANPQPVEEIANHIIEAGLLCRKYNVEEIYVSSILPRKQFYMQKRRDKLNKILSGLCDEHGFVFINNNNITLNEHIGTDGVHLNSDGTDLLSKNFIDHLNGIHRHSSGR